MSTAVTNESSRVLAVVTNPLGGIRTYMLYNFRPLQEAGYRFTFLAPAGEAFSTFQRDIADWEGAEFVEVPVDGRKFSFVGTVRRELRRRRYALMHSQGLRAGTEACMANLSTRVPHAVTLHDVIVPGNDIPGRFKWLKKRLIGRLTSRADVIIPVSHDCAANHLEHFPEWKRGRCRIEVIPNGVDVAKLEEATAAVTNCHGLRKELGLSDDVFLLGFFGRFMPQKNFLLLLDALSQLATEGFHDRIHLVAVDDRNGYAHYRTEARRPNLCGMVTLVEPVPNVATYLCQIDALIMPSQWEACPLLPMEAMVLGVPVIGSDCIGLREVLEDTPAKLCVHGDTPSLLKAILDTREAKGAKEAAIAYVAEARGRFTICESSYRLKRIIAETLCREPL